MAAKPQTYTLTGGDEVIFHKIKPGIVQSVKQRSQAQMLQYLPQMSKLNLSNLSSMDDMTAATTLAQGLDTAALQALADMMQGDVKEFIEWGVELVSQLPDGDQWVRLLRRNQKDIDWSLYDLNDDFDRRALYVRYVAFGSEEDWNAFYEKTGLRALGVTGGFGTSPKPALPDGEDASPEAEPE